MIGKRVLKRRLLRKHERHLINAPEIQEIAEIVQNARRILFITGAGISADSGLPTYRGIGGLYNDILTEDNVSIETALSGATFAKDPLLTWKYLIQVESACRGAGHNIGHRIISEFERFKPESWVLTQNIDGLHRSAGSNQLIEIHGNVTRLHCTSCRFSEIVPSYAGISPPPICPRCFGIMRPGVVLFGESLPLLALDALQTQLSLGFDLIFSIGTTSVFPYIAQPVLDAHYWGAKTVEINPGVTEVSDAVDYKLTLRAAEALPAIWAAMGKTLPKL
ncbi:NAD-dependent deacetylase 2 [gamma proteobacterium HdN1]|nr:NAD-dependent deacetylase 2 [gamma proteobacterium HdN1]